MLIFSSRSKEQTREVGFTLIELLIVVIIIGILAAIALPIFLNQRAAAKDASAQSDVRNTVAQVQDFVRQHPGVAISNAAEYTDNTNKGKLVNSKGDYVGVTIDNQGNYTICGFNPDGKKYSDPESTWTFSSASGKSGIATGTTCDGVTENADGTYSTYVDPSAGGNNGGNSNPNGQDGGTHIYTVNRGFNSIPNDVYTFNHSQSGTDGDGNGGSKFTKVDFEGPFDFLNGTRVCDLNGQNDHALNGSGFATNIKEFDTNGNPISLTTTDDWRLDFGASCSTNGYYDGSQYASGLTEYLNLYDPDNGNNISGNAQTVQFDYNGHTYLLDRNEGQGS